MTEIVLAIERARLPRVITAIRRKASGTKARESGERYGQNISATPQSSSLCFALL
jgi:hypothetical protein